jgi:hypothetical protein
MLAAHYFQKLKKSYNIKATKTLHETLCNQVLQVKNKVPSCYSADLELKIRWRKNEKTGCQSSRLSKKCIGT